MPTLVTVALIACGAAVLLQWRRRRATRRFFASRYRDPATLIPDGGGVTALYLLVAAVAMAVAAFIARQDRAARQAAPPTLCFLLDCSPSMLAAGRSGPRLAEAKEMITAIIDALPECELCLVSFAGNAIVDFPPSRDQRAFRRALAAVEPSLALAAGSSPSQALQALEALIGADAQQPAHAVLIMLSDGEINDPEPLLQDIPWIARAFPLLHVLTGIPGQDTPVPSPQGPLWLNDPDSGRVATSRADDRALQTLAALSPQPAEFFTAADHATAVTARIRQLAGGEGRNGSGWLAVRALAFIALAALLAARWPRRPTRARNRTEKATATKGATTHGVATHSVLNGRRASAVSSALLALLTWSGSAIADGVPAGLRSDAVARADAMAAIRENIARDNCDGAERARLLSNWSALLVVEAEAAISAGALDAAARHATAARELSREAQRLQPGNAATLQNLAAAWRVLQEAQAMQARKDGPSDAADNGEPDSAATAHSRPDDAQGAQSAHDASASADGTANAGAAPGTANTASAGAALDTADAAPDSNAAGSEATSGGANARTTNAPVGTWRDLQLQRHYRPPRPPGVKPW
ncbi:MAG: VWA domain-containing protein [Lentisphaeria bacterium]|nr:VWA domain-containing protein [Lentisphaeria bacterium]